MKRLPTWVWPLLVASVALSVTAWLWNHERQSQELNLRTSFDFGVRQTTTRVEARITSYEQMLRGVGGLFYASDEVTRKDFADYVDVLAAGPDFAGLRSIAYAPLLRQSQAESAASTQAAPAGINGDARLSAPLTYAAPAVGPIVGELGYDLFADPLRRQAMKQAMESGGITVTQRLRIGDADAAALPEWGFMLCMPLYEKGRPHHTVELRREHLSGWVFASFRIKDLMSSLYGEGTPGLEVRIYDGVDIGDSSRLYPGGADSGPLRAARFDAQEYVGLAGHTWTVQVRSTPEFEQRFSNASAQVIAVSGGGLSLVLTLLTWQLLTRRERAYAAAREMTRQLRDSSEQYRRIVETADEGIWMIDADGNTSFANPKLQRMLGYRADELNGRKWTDFMDPAGSGKAAVDGLDPLRVRRSEPLELSFRRSDGAELWGSLSTSPIFDESGRYLGGLAMVTDISRRKLAETNRAQLEEQLRQSQKMEAIGTLAGGVAHDFNNILASILGNTALVSQDLGAAHPQSVRLEQIRLAGERGRSLVQQIVAFSRRESRERQAQPLRPLLEETVKLLRATLPALVEVELQLSEAPLQISADATQLQQVLINLCTNAWHAMAGDKGRIVIGLDAVSLDAQAALTLGGLQPGRHAHLWVDDDGSGMDEATRQRIFEPFYTTKAVGKGTGLGLAVVHGIVASHGGVIRVESSPGRGSRFEMYFPLLDAAAQPDAAAAAAPAPERGRGQHVLYVDDDPVMVVMVEALLRRAGYRVTSLVDPGEALARASAAHDAIDVLVTDFNMPGLSGLDLAQQLRRIRPALPIVITSGNIPDKLRLDASRAGVRHLLQKEYTLERLGELVHRVLSESSSTSSDKVESAQS